MRLRVLPMAVLFVALPLSGCLLPPEEPALLAGEAVYEGDGWVLHLRLTGPVSVLMGDGPRREANLLESWIEGSPDGVTAMALDGSLRSLWRYDECFIHGVAGCESPAQVDWSAHGRLGLYGVGWMQAGPWQRVEYDSLPAPIHQDGDALVVRDDPDLPRAGALGLIEGRYEYADGGLFPTRMVLDGGATLERVSWTPSGPLATVPVHEPLPPPTGANGLFPGSDEAVFANGTVDDSLRALRADAEADAAVRAGCFQYVAFPRDWSRPSGGGLLQTRESEAFHFGVGGPQRGAWSVTRSWDDVDALPDEYGVERDAPEQSLGTCRPRPEALVSPRAFLEAASPFLPSEPRLARLSFEVGSRWASDLSSVPVLWRYDGWGGQGSASGVSLEMDAHSGAWRLWRVPVGEVEAAGLVQAATAADVDSSLRNQ